MSAQEDIKKVPPNGKWGWMIVLGYALNGISVISLLHGFGLIFKDIFRRFGFSATQGTIIINSNFAFGSIIGLINGPLLRIFGFRKMAVFGSLLYTTAVTATAFVSTFPFFMIFYGIFASLGMTITFSSFSYALNSYFTTKRGRAMSLAMTVVGLGPIIVPQVTSFLISLYGFQGTIMLYGAFSLHSLVGSMLLQPLKWHTKVVKSQSDSTNNGIETMENKIVDEKNNSQSQEILPNSMLDLNRPQRSRKITTSSIDYDAEIGSIYGLDILFAGQLCETINNRNKFQSTESMNFGSKMTIFNEIPDSSAKYSNLCKLEEDDRNLQDKVESDSLLEKQQTKAISNQEANFNEKTESKEKSAVSQIFKRIAETFDLDLLRDPIYINIMLGISIAAFAELNFSQLTPFILADIKLSTNEIASVMSVIATVDLIFRSLAPFLGEWLRQPPRIMYLLSLCLLIVGRMSIVFINKFTSMLFAAVGLGAAKGIRSVYMYLVIPHYVPIEKLPNASGIQMIANGIILLTAGPTLGAMRDSIGSYTPCIILINCVTALTVGMWSTEMFFTRRRKLKLQRKQQDET
ncbi:uncharacterized protein LOC143180050 [Calliopsis andreniformis]|uniref:uncharacterized protein LOC143180050 n=1 Tax=Calliopsis andreniformis TaxID=337506 RepID=UPI003FCD196D